MEVKEKGEGEESGDPPPSTTGAMGLMGPAAAGPFRMLWPLHCAGRARDKVGTWVTGVGDKTGSRKSENNLAHHGRLHGRLAQRLRQRRVERARDVTGRARRGDEGVQVAEQRCVR